MPEMKFDVRWPDGKVTRCYSPSLVVCELLEKGDYPVFEFMERVRAALNIGAERVRLKFGFYCSAAMDQLQELEVAAGGYEKTDALSVLALYPDGADLAPLPNAEPEPAGSQGQP